MHISKQKLKTELKLWRSEMLENRYRIKDLAYHSERPAKDYIDRNSLHLLLFNRDGTSVYIQYL